MPNIHGLCSLMCLLFAPFVEMRYCGNGAAFCVLYCCVSCRTDEDKTQYTGVLCGLGWDPSTGKGLYEDHDIECTFDTIFTQDDLEQVTEIFVLHVLRDVLYRLIV